MNICMRLHLWLPAGALLAACSDPSHDPATGHQAEALNGGSAGVASAEFPDAGGFPAAFDGGYNGGPLLSNVSIVSVFWGPNVNATVKSQIGGFYSAVTNDSYTDWLDEYDSLSTTTPHSVGRGSLAQTVTITPANTHTTLADGDISTELASQIGAGVLPHPGANTLYVVQFPLGDVITGPGYAGVSCAPLGFCGYHTSATKTISGTATTFSYAILPDFGVGSGCDTGCGTGAMFDNFTSTASHVIAGSITDPQPFSGVSALQSELGDICNQRHGTIVASTGTLYAVQSLFSLSAGDCMFDSNPRATAAVSRGSAGMDVFYRASDRNLHTSSFNGSTWTTDTPLGGPIDSAPAAVARSSTRIDVFARWTDGTLHTQSWNGSTWSGFSPLQAPVQFVGSPAVLSRDGNTIDVFVRGTDNTLYTKTWDGSNWNNYLQLGTTQFVGNPSAVSWGSNRIDVFVRGTDGTLNTQFWNGSTWSGFKQLGTEKILGNPAVDSWGPNRIDVFVRGTDSTLYTKSWNGSVWSGYTQLGSNIIVGSVSAVSWAANRIDVFVRGTDRNLYTKSWNNGSVWSGYTQVATGAIVNTPVAVSRASGSLNVFVRGSNAALYTVGGDGSIWSGYESLNGSLY
jgi:hypothetical protein